MTDNDRALVADDQDDVGIVGVDPDALVIVAARSAAEAGPGLAAVGGFPRDGAGDVDGVGILGIDGGDGEIAAADASGGTRVGSGARPMFAGVVGAIDADSVGSGDGGVEAVGIARRDGDVGLYEAIGAGRNAVGERTPGGAAVGGFEHAAAGTGPRAVFPGTLARFPERGVDGIGMGGIDLDFAGAGVFVLAEDLFECPAAIGGAIEAALGIRSVRVAEHGDEELVGIARIDGDLRDLLAVAQAEMRPRLAGVGGFVDAVAGGEIGTLQSFAAAGVDDVGIGGRDGERADGAGGLVVEDGVPGAAVIGGLPDAAVAHADVEDVGLPGDPLGGFGASGA